MFSLLLGKRFFLGFDLWFAWAGKEVRILAMSLLDALHFNVWIVFSWVMLSWAGNLGREMFVFHEEVFSCVFPKKMLIISSQLIYDPLSFTINFFMSSSASFFVLAKYLAGPGLFLPQLLKLQRVF